MEPTCSTCRYFVPDLDEEELAQAIENDEEDPDTGTCHRGAPQPVMYCFLPKLFPEVKFDADGRPIEEEEEGPDTTAIWPAVDAEDYCSQYKMIDRKKK